MFKATIAIIDIVIIIVLSFFMYRGHKNGFLTEFTRAFGTILALILAIRYMSNLAIAIYGAVNISPVVATVLSFIAIFTAVFFGFNYLSTKFIRSVNMSLTLGSIDRIAGIASGLVKGSIIVSLITVLLSFATFSGPLRNEIKESMLFNPMRNVLPLAYSVAKLIYQKTYQPLYKELDESFSGQSENRRAEAQDVIDFYRPK
ncbi:CvpA family protein [candidate division KSB1 bacterium]|nr:CvpA family protein [candidate division KSB1 bacterium]